MNIEMFDEVIPYQNLMLCIQIRKREKRRQQKKRWHYHRELEFAYVLEGVLGKQIQDKQYRLEPGEALIVGSSQPHCSWCADGDATTYLILHFDLQPYFDPSLMTYYHFFYEITGPLSQLNETLRQNEELRISLGQHMKSIYDEMEQKTVGYELAIQLQVKQLLLLLLRCGPNEAPKTNKVPPAYNLRPVIDYVERHLQENIEMETVSQMVNMSYHYFSKYFKKMVGMSFVDYVNIQRIKKAERLLLTEKINITQVAEMVGFVNMTHFYDLFKRYNHCSPKEYIRRLLPDASEFT
ncbi:HTH-type transcriptional activator RhaS [Paenibacillus solanacearum]|uniref:HTH-type transcriptional activator RhaS n=1 Tax=Paenibacillus solanacearum TaxID=2048548 RepID=A0A916NR22_9BACL|nr:AraC family transcriptional regulator [Paenibacillus solanacearum]CAG7644317.1 HTH-type transcriptional activator RhaS [Paenibacillus solanacearum]